MTHRVSGAGPGGQEHQGTARRSGGSMHAWHAVVRGNGNGMAFLRPVWLGQVSPPVSPAEEAKPAPPAAQ